MGNPLEGSGDSRELHKVPEGVLAKQQLEEEQVLDIHDRVWEVLDKEEVRASLSELSGKKEYWDKVDAYVETVVHALGSQDRYTSVQVRNVFQDLLRENPLH